MKNNFLNFVLLLLFNCCFSQEDKIPITKKLSYSSSFSIGIIRPIQYGSTALADGHSSNIGFTSSKGILEFLNFTVGVGLDYIIYTVEDKQVIGNYPSSKHNSYFFYVNYDFPITKTISITPTFGYGYSELVIKKSGKRRGAQEGNELRLGTSINYNFIKKMLYAC